MKCPRDNENLESVEGSDEVLKCPSCEGLFIGVRDVREAVAAALKGKNAPSEGALFSPYDGKPMVPVLMDGVVIDVCVTSGYVWFDKGEYQKIALDKQTKGGAVTASDVATEGTIEVGCWVARDPSIVAAVFDSIGNLFESIRDSISIDLL